MNAAVVHLRAYAKRLIEDGRKEGIEPDGPLGLWREGQARALHGLADVLDGQTDRIDALMARLSAAASVELEKAAAATALATRAIEAGEIALQQVRNAQVALVVEQESVTKRMVDQTLPFFATKLKDALVIREQRWNKDARRRRLGVAAAVTLAIFIGGYALRAWSDADRLDAFDRCLAHALPSGGHLFCDVTRFSFEANAAGK